MKRRFGTHPVCRGIAALSFFLAAICLAHPAFSDSYSHTFSKGWHLFGVPFQVLGTPKFKDLNLTFEKAFGFINDDYANPSDATNLTIKTQEGYWIYFPVEREISFSGQIFSLSSFTKQLTAGWNLFSMPYHTKVCWNDTNVYFNQVKLSLSNYLESGPWEFDPTTRAYRTATCLEPWKAYWVKVKRDVPLKVNLFGTACAADADCPDSTYHCQNPCQTNAVCVQCSEGKFWDGDECAEPVIVCSSHSDCPGDNDFCKDPGTVSSQCVECGLDQLWDGDQCIENPVACSGDGDCPGEDAHCQNPGQETSICVQCTTKQLWSGGVCADIDCTADADCGASNAYCRNGGTLEADCVACGEGQAWDGEECVDPACASDADCTAEDSYCRNPGEADAVCVHCLPGQLWDGDDCAYPACFIDADCGGGNVHCLDPGSLDASCVTCQPGQLWDGGCVTPVCSLHSECPGDYSFCRDPATLTAECVDCAAGSLWDGDDCAAMPPSCNNDADCPGDKNFCRNPGLPGSECVACDLNQVWNGATQACATPACFDHDDCAGDDNYCKAPGELTAQCAQCGEDDLWVEEECFTPICLSDLWCPGQNSHCLNPGQQNSTCVQCALDESWTGLECVDCLDDGDCPAGGYHCQNPALTNAVCVRCEGIQLWNGAQCVDPACVSHDDCPGDDNYCSDPYLLTAVCVECGVSQTWDGIQCVDKPSFCSADEECPGDDNYCRNPGAENSECVVCDAIQVWDGDQCVTPACFDHDDCPGDDNYCRDPALLTAVCVACDPLDAWDETTQICVTPECYSHDDCPGENNWCQYAATAQANCLPCEGGEYWYEDEQTCRPPECASHDDCPGDLNFCRNSAQQDAECVPCETGQLWDDEAEECVTPACSSEDDCALADDHCMNPGQVDAVCIVCEPGTVWDQQANACVAPACYTNADCQGAGRTNYMSYCKDPGQAVASCVTCPSQQTWDADAQTCVSLYDLSMIRNVADTQCAISNKRTKTITPDDEVAVVTVEYWDLSYKSYESVEGRIQPITIRGYLAIPQGQSFGPGIVQAHGLGGYAQENDAPNLAALTRAAVIAYTGPGSGKGQPAESEGLGPDHESGYRLFDTLEDTRENWFWSYSVAGMRAVNCLEQLPQVDDSRIGFTGYSAGGVMTLMVSGRDDRVMAGVPRSANHGWEEAVKDHNAWQIALMQQAGKTKDDPEWLKLVQEMITPSASQAGQRANINMFNGSVDEFFPLTAQMKTFDALPGDRRHSLSISGNFDHGCTALLGIPLVDSANNIKDRAYPREKGAIRAWFGHWFANKSTYGYFPAMPVVTAFSDLAGVTYIAVTVDSGGSKLQVENVNVWNSADNAYIFVNHELVSQGNGVYVGKDKLYGIPYVPIATNANNMYFVDVLYTDGNLLTPQRFSVTSRVNIPGGMVAHLRGINSCVWP